jgi:hypothetical protein
LVLKSFWFNVGAGAKHIFSAVKEMALPAKDMETGEKASLLGFEASRPMLKDLGSYRGKNERGGLATLPEVPVGGHPGNDKFYTVVQLAVRLTVMCLLIGSMVWFPEQTSFMSNYASTQAWQLA